MNARDRHILSNKDFENMTAECSVCGGVIPMTVHGRKKRYQCKASYDYGKALSKGRTRGLSFQTWRERFHEGCEACGSRPVVLDHDHSTGLFRGLLCVRCNTCIGFSKDNPKTLRSLASYLDKNVGCTEEPLRKPTLSSRG